MSTKVMSCHQRSCHVIKGHVMSSKVMLCHQRSCHQRDSGNATTNTIVLKWERRQQLAYISVPRTFASFQQISLFASSPSMNQRLALAGPPYGLPRGKWRYLPPRLLPGVHRFRSAKPSLYPLRLISPCALEKYSACATTDTQEKEKTGPRS